MSKEIEILRKEYITLMDQNAAIEKRLDEIEDLVGEPTSMKWMDKHNKEKENGTIKITDINWEDAQYEAGSFATTEDVC